MFEPYSAIITFLHQHQASFEELEHEPVYTSKQAAQVYGFDLSSGAKSLLIKADQNFVLLILPGDKRLDTKKAKQILHVKNLRFATPAEVEQVMGCQVGACYPFGNLIGIKMLVDESLSSQTFISFNPGLHHKSIKLRWSDYAAAVQPELNQFVK